VAQGEAKDRDGKQVRLGRHALLAPFFALITLLFDASAEASLPRTSAPVIEAPALTLASPAPEPFGFSLFEGTELARAAAAPGSAESFHPLAAVSLLSEDLRHDLAPRSDVSYPKTRVWAIDVLGSTLVSRSTELSLETHWACVDFSCGLASGGRKDPLGLQGLPPIDGTSALQVTEEAAEEVATKFVPRVIQGGAGAGAEAGAQSAGGLAGRVLLGRALGLLPAFFARKANTPETERSPVPIVPALPGISPYSSELLGLPYESLRYLHLVRLHNLYIQNAKKKGSLPEWLRRRWAAGQEFDALNRGRYPFNEVEVVSPEGEKFRLDSYNPDQREIVFRRETQFADIQLKTAVNYFNEFLRKYPEGATITRSPFNPRILWDQRLQGQYIFEVPKQEKPIPGATLDAALERGIVIRDVEGNVYK